MVCGDWSKRRFEKRRRIKDGKRMRRPVALIVPMFFWLPLAACGTMDLKLAPEQPEAPWTPSTTPSGEIAGSAPAQGQPKADSYVLPSNRNLAGVPEASSDLERRTPYTLAGLINIAQTNNPTTRNAWNNARNAALTAGIAEATFLPVVSAGIVQGWQKSHNDMSLLGSNTSSDVTAKGNIEVLSIQWLLFDFGQRAARLDAANQLSVISNIAFTEAHQQVIYNVSLAFYSYAAARAHLASASISLQDAQDVQAAAEDRYKRGIGTVVEVAQTRQSTAEAQLARVQADGAVQNGYLALISAMGISPMTQLPIADISRRHLPPSLTVSIEHFVAEALARRPDVLTGYAAQKASLANLRAAEAEFFPKVFFSGTGSRLAGSLDVTAIPGLDQQLPIVNIPGNQLGSSIRETGTTALVGATMPLYDGGTRAALLEQARDNVDKANTTLTQIRNEAARQIIVAKNTLKTSLSAYNASTALAEAAQATFDSALAAYRNGVGSISDVTIAERQLLAAKNTATDAYSTALSAAATLALAAGSLG
jgi:outer membrane protein